MYWCMSNDVTVVVATRGVRVLAEVRSCLTRFVSLGGKALGEPSPRVCLAGQDVLLPIPSCRERQKIRSSSTEPQDLRDPPQPGVRWILQLGIHLTSTT